MWFLYLCLIVGAIIGISKLITYIKEQKVKKEQLRAITLSKEPSVDLLSKYSDKSFNYEEERKLTIKINEYIQKQNEIAIIENKINHLRKVKEAYAQLKDYENHNLKQKEIIALDAKLKDLKRNVINYDTSRFNAIKKHVNLPSVDGLFNDLSYKSFLGFGGLVRCLEINTCTFYFTPLCIIKDTGSSISFLKYSNCHVGSEKYQETTTDYNSDDTVIRQYWQYQRKDGRRDNRYSNNPLYRVVERGKVSLTFPDKNQYVTKTSNTPNTIALFNKYKLFIEKYKSAAKIIDSILKSNDISTYDYSKVKVKDTTDKVKQLENKVIEACKIKDFRIIGREIISYNGDKKIITLPDREYADSLKENCFSTSKVETVIIPEGYYKIPKAAFIFSKVKTVVLPKSVKVIESDAFYGCGELLEINLDHVEHIGNNAFYNCGKLKEIDLMMVKTISKDAFCSCQNLKYIKIGTNCVEIYSGAFSKCDNINTLNLDLKEIKFNDSIFSYQGTIKNLIIGNNTKIIHSRSFDRIKSIENITIGTSIECIYAYSFNFDFVKTLTINGSNCQILDNAFSVQSYSNKPVLTEINFPNGIKSIGKNNFENCDKLEKLDLSRGINEIGANCFSNCKNLKEVLFVDGAIKFGNQSFSNCNSLKEISLPKHAILGNEVFSKCSKLEIVNGISLTKEMIASGCFESSKYLANNVSGGFVIVDSVLVEYLGKEEKVIIPNTVTTIDSYAFNKNNKVKSVIILENVKKINNFAFNDCKKLEYVNIVSSKTIVSNYSFSGCSNLVKRDKENSTKNNTNSSESNKSSNKIVELAQLKDKKVTEVVKTNKTINLFKKGDFVEHISFGKGQISNITQEYYYIKFDGFDDDKIISRKYQDLKPYVQRYVFHNNYLYGKIIKEEINNYVILFDSGEEKIISKIYKGISIIDEKTYINKLVVVNKKEKEIKEEKSGFVLYDVIKHSMYGKGIITSIYDNMCDVIFTNAQKTSFFVNSDKLLFVENLANKANMLNSLSHLTYIYSEGKGYGIVCMVGRTQIHVLWKSTSKIEVIDKEIILISEIIKSKETINKIKLNKYDIISHKEYGLCYVDSFIDKHMGIRSLNSPAEIKWVKLDSINVLNKEELLSFDINKKNLFVLELTQSCYELHDAVEIYNDYHQVKGNTMEILRQYSKLGFKLFDEKYLIKSETGDLESCLINEFINKEVYRYDYGLESNKYDYILKKLMSAHYIIEYEEGIYFTYSKFASLGLTLSDFESLESDLVNFIESNKFATLSQIKENVKNKIFEKIVSSYALEKLISMHDRIIQRKIGGIIIYQLKDMGKKADAISELITLSMKKLQVESINVYDFVEYLNEKYEFEFDFYSFVDLFKTLKDTSLFYSEDTEKIYIDKKQYNKEIFGRWN